MTSQLFKFTVYMALVVFEVGSLSQFMTNMDHTSFTFDEADSVGENRRWTLASEYRQNVQCEPKHKSKLVKEPVAKIVRLKASYIGGKLARGVKAAHMNILQAVIY